MCQTLVTIMSYLRTCVKDNQVTEASLGVRAPEEDNLFACCHGRVVPRRIWNGSFGTNKAPLKLLCRRVSARELAN